MQKFDVKNKLIVYLLIVLFTYPLFYYSYKFGNPSLGNRDFFDYYPIYKDLNVSAVESPFCTRLISGFLIYLVHKTGINYGSEVSFHKEGIDTQVYFSAVLFNYFVFTLACFCLYVFLNKIHRNSFYSFLFVFIFILGFGTQFYLINTLTESFSMFLFFFIFISYYYRSYWIIPLLLLCIIQREYFFFVMGLWAAFDFLIIKRNRYFIFVFLTAVSSFAIYIALRKTIFYTPTYSEQLNAGGYLSHLLNPGIEIGHFIKQSFLNQNIYILYLLVIAYKLIKKIPFDQPTFYLLLAFLVQIIIISLIAGLGNSAGRYFYTLMPFVIFVLSIELKPLIKENFNWHGTLPN